MTLACRTGLPPLPDPPRNRPRRHPWYETEREVVLRISYLLLFVCERLCVRDFVCKSEKKRLCERIVHTRSVIIKELERASQLSLLILIHTTLHTTILGESSRNLTCEGCNAAVCTASRTPLHRYDYIFQAYVSFRCRLTSVEI